MAPGKKAKDDEKKTKTKEKNSEKTSKKSSVIKKSRSTDSTLKSDRNAKQIDPLKSNKNNKDEEKEPNEEHSEKPKQDLKAKKIFPKTLQKIEEKENESDNESENRQRNNLSFSRESVNPLSKSTIIRRRKRKMIDIDTRGNKDLGKTSKALIEANSLKEIEEGSVASSEVLAENGEITTSNKQLIEAIKKSMEHQKKRQMQKEGEKGERDRERAIESERERRKRERESKRGEGSARFFLTTSSCWN